MVNRKSNEEGVKPSNIGDQAASQDLLGFEPYVSAMADFLINPETKPPLTISIEGKWGSGKTSFMKQLEKAIESATRRNFHEDMKEKLIIFSKIISSLQDLSFLQKHIDFYVKINEWRDSGKKISFYIKIINNNNLRKYILYKHTFYINKKIRFCIYFTWFLLDWIITIPKISVCILRFIYRQISLFYFYNLKSKPRIIWFNAWRHEKSEALWAAFALTFLGEISKIREFKDILPVLSGHIKLLISRFKFGEKCLENSKIIAKILIGFSVLLLIIFSIGKFNPLMNKDFIKAVNQTEKLILFELSKADKKLSLTSNHSGYNSSNNNSSPKIEEEKRNSRDKDWLAKVISWMIKEFPLWGAFIGTAGFYILQVLQQLNKIIETSKIDLIKYIKSPDYEGKVEFIEKFHKDLKKIVDAYSGKDNKVYVFIDDLDRCEVPKSAELMQSINLMISNDPCLIFLLGMDREKIAASVAVKHEKLLPYLEAFDTSDYEIRGGHSSLIGMNYGYIFVEKFIQISFKVPRPSQNNYEKFLNTNNTTNEQSKSIWHKIGNFLNKCRKLIKQVLPLNKQSPDYLPGNLRNLLAITTTSEGHKFQKGYKKKTIDFVIGKDSPKVKEICKMVTPTLDYNPRRLKQFLNIFRLKAYIAFKTGLFDAYYIAKLSNSTRQTVNSELKDYAITLEQLGKFIAIGLKWPLLFVDLEKEEELLTELQKYALNPFYQIVKSRSFNYWRQNQSLMELLRYDGNNTEKKQDYSLLNVNIKKLLEVSPAVPPLESERGVDYSQLRDLLASGQWREANSETDRVLLEASGRRVSEDRLSFAYLTLQDIERFPCTDLKTIDELWLYWSDNRYGFSVQNRIWNRLSNEINSMENRVNSFIREVGRLGGEEKEFNDGFYPNPVWGLGFPTLIFAAQHGWVVGWATPPGIQPLNFDMRPKFLSSFAQRFVSCSMR